MNKLGLERVARDVRLRSPRALGSSAAFLYAGMALVAALAHAQSLADSPWVGTWLLYEPSHGSYQATEYRFLPTGELRLSATVDTTSRDPTRDRILGRVYRGRTLCAFGARWRPDPTPTRVVIEGSCTDGRARDIVLEVGTDFFERASASGSPRIVSVGGRRGFGFTSAFDNELMRCSRDPAEPCWALENRRDVHRRSEREPEP